MLLKSRLNIYLVFIIPFSLCVTFAKKYNGDTVKYDVVTPIIDDFPRRGDLKMYIGVTNDILKFAIINKTSIERDFQLALFLVEVNLKQVIIEKEYKIPVSILQDINELLKKTEYLKELYTKTYVQEHDGSPAWSLFSNATAWACRLRTYSGAVPRKQKVNNRTEMHRKNSHADASAEDDIDLPEYFIYSPIGGCLESLADNPIDPIDGPRKCIIKDTCYNFILDGEEWKYLLAQRILLLLCARLARGCLVLSRLLDQQLSKKLCTAAYNESSFIVTHNFKSLSDLNLIFEHIGYCALEDHTQFIRRAWMKELARFQTEQGYFIFNLKNVRNTKLGLNLKSVNHVTANAAIAFSSVIRSVIMAYY